MLIKDPTTRSKTLGVSTLSSKLVVGKKVENFTLIDTNLNPIQLKDLLHQGKPVVLLFFPAAFSSICTKELCTFRDRMAQLDRTNAIVVAISTDSPWCLREFAEKNRLNFTLLSDYNREVITRYGIYHEEIAGLRLLAKRAVLILDQNGVLRYKWVSDDPRIEPDYEKVLRETERIFKS